MIGNVFSDPQFVKAFEEMSQPLKDIVVQYPPNGLYTYKKTGETCCIAGYNYNDDQGVEDVGIGIILNGHHLIVFPEEIAILGGTFH